MTLPPRDGAEPAERRDVYGLQMQPLLEVTITRPWHWGVAVISAPSAVLPDGIGNKSFVASPDALVITVRHAQDVDAEPFEGDWALGVASLHVRSLAGFEDVAGPAVYDGVLDLPESRLQVGDADSYLTIDHLWNRTRVRVYGDLQAAPGATSVQIDLAPEATADSSGRGTG